MRAFSIFVVTLFILWSCNRGADGVKRSDTAVVHKLPADTIAETSQQDSAINYDYLVEWTIDFENRTKQKNQGFKESFRNVDSMIKALNEMFLDIKLDKIKVSHDTLYTEIKDSEYLGERMGTSGAGFYIATAIINLTSVKGARFVSINFEDHSHASPGIWSKKDFNDYKEIR